MRNKMDYQVTKKGFLGRRSSYKKSVPTQNEAKKLFYEARTKGHDDVKIERVVSKERSKYI